MSAAEKVILVDEQDAPVGLMEKMEAHRQGKLHRAFSIFIFDQQKRVILQRRAAGKYHSAGLWSNTCCGHPRDQELTVEAANRRLYEEMGFQTPLTKIFDFTYKASVGKGLTEHEFDHVYVGVYDGVWSPNPVEISDVMCMSIDQLEKALDDRPQDFSAWLKIIFPRVQSWAVTHLSTMPLERADGHE